MSADRTFVYVGLAGDTEPDKPKSAGLYCSRGGDGPWERVDGGIDPAPQVRAIATDPRRPGRVTIGTQHGIWRSDDGGRRWARLDAPPPGLAVWSLLVHPLEPDTILAGYEPCAIWRSTDDGATWRALPVAVTFPAVTLAPTPRPKRVTGIAVDPARPDDIYASIEVGGLLRSADGGESWTCTTDGLYLVDDAVDLHRVVASPARPGTITTIGRIGAFQSADRGRHWAPLPVPGLAGPATYCRDLVPAPGEPDTLYLGGGTAFDGDVGALFKSTDHGRSWRRLDLGATPRSAVFACAADAAGGVYCAAKGGEAFWSRDRGATWRANPLPAGLTRVYCMAVG